MEIHVIIYVYVWCTMCSVRLCIFQHNMPSWSKQRSDVWLWTGCLRLEKACVPCARAFMWRQEVGSAHVFWFRCHATDIRLIILAKINSEITVNHPFTLALSHGRVQFIPSSFYLFWRAPTQITSEVPSIILNALSGSCFSTSLDDLTLTGNEPTPSSTVIEDGIARKAVRSGSWCWAGCYTDPRGCGHGSVAAGSRSDSRYTSVAICEAANTGS